MEWFELAAKTYVVYIAISVGLPLAIILGLVAYGAYRFWKT